MDVHVVPLGASADDGRRAVLEGPARELGDLLAAGVDGPAAGAVDGGRAEDGDAHGGGVGREGDLVDVAMEGVVREVEDTVDVLDVGVLLLGERGLAVALVGFVVLGGRSILSGPP